MSLELSSPFWKFSIKVYAAPGVADNCIGLQERFGIDVNVLLFCGWVGWSRGHRLNAAQIAAANALVRSWNESTVKPIRSVRRFTKDMPEDAVKRLRARVKTIELDTEQIEQAMLYAHAEQLWPGGAHAGDSAAALANMMELLLAHGWRPITGEKALDRLNETIANLG